MTYKFLLFDLDHTLLDFDVAEDIALTQLLKEEGVVDIRAYKDYYVPMNKTLWKDLEEKKITKKALLKNFHFLTMPKTFILLYKSNYLPT